MGSFRLLGRLGWLIGRVSWWCAPLSSAQSMRRRRIRLWGSPGGKSAKRSGASVSERAGGGQAPRRRCLLVIHKRELSTAENFKFS